MINYGHEQKSFQSRKTNLIFLVLLILVIFIWALLLSPDHGGLVAANLNIELRLDFVNVGQGDAVLIRTPKGKNYLIGGGISVPANDARLEGRELIQNYLRNQKISKLDGVIITNWHNDHLGGIIPVLRMFDIGRIYETPSGFDSESIKAYEEICKKSRILRTTVKAGDVLEWGNELFVQVLNPEKANKSKKNTDVNNQSVVLLIRYGKVQTLLTGDIEEESEREVMKYGKDIKSQILKVPHHGADTSDYLPFLEMVKAEAGIIMVGKKNPFGHPAMRTISRYEKINTKLYRTDRNGTIRLLIGGKDAKDYRFVVDQRL